MSATYIVESVSSAVNVVRLSSSCLGPQLIRRVLIVVDLRSLQLVGIVDVNSLPFGEEIDGGDRRFAVAVPGLLGAAKRQMRFGAYCWRVDVDDSRVEIARSHKGLVYVARVNRGRQSIRHAVGDFNSLLETVDGDNRDHRAEDLFLRDAHLRRAIAKHG